MFQQWIIPQISCLSEDFVFAPVVFPIAKWVGTTNCSVPVFQGFQELIKMLQQFPQCLTTEQVLKISKLIENYEILDVPKPSAKPKPILRKSSSS